MRKGVVIRLTGLTPRAWRLVDARSLIENASTSKLCFLTHPHPDPGLECWMWICAETLRPRWHEVCATVPVFPHPSKIVNSWSTTMNGWKRNEAYQFSEIEWDVIVGWRKMRENGFEDKNVQNNVLSCFVSRWHPVGLIGSIWWPCMKNIPFEETSITILMTLVKFQHWIDDLMEQRPLI